MMELKGKRGNMSYDDIKKLLEENNQEQLLKYYNELSDTQKANLLDQISKLDFSLIDLIKNKSYRHVKIHNVQKTRRYGIFYLQKQIK